MSSFNSQDVYDSILYLKHNFEILNKALEIFTINTNDITTLTNIASITAKHTSSSPRPCVARDR